MWDLFNQNKSNFIMIPMILPLGCCNCSFTMPFDDSYHRVKLKHYMSREEFTEAIKNINNYIQTATNTTRLLSKLLWFLPIIGFAVFISGIISLTSINNKCDCTSDSDCTSSLYNTCNVSTGKCCGGSFCRRITCDADLSDIFGRMFGGLFAMIFAFILALCVSRAVPDRMMDATRAAVRTVNNRFSDRNMVWTFQAPLGNLRMVGGASSLGAKIVIELVDEDNNNGNNNNNVAGIVVGDSSVYQDTWENTPKDYDNEGNATNIATTQMIGNNLVFCPKCGCKHESSDSFCPKCGNKTVIPH